jgi:signal transduction histidine kinase
VAASLAGGGGELPEARHGGGAGQRPVSILLVDDQPARLLTYEAVLRDLGYNLVLAQSGSEALHWLMREEFALLLLDVSMPQMDGFETARLIHEHPRFEKTPIIFVTGVHVTELDHLRGYEAGAVDYVSIPVVPEILRSKVGVLVELYLKRRELRELNASLGAANARLAEANLTLQAEKTRELERLNATLQQANADLERANTRLQREVAERARAEQALKDADRRKDEFLATLAHELRNPLAPIRYALAAGKRGGTPAQHKHATEVIERQVAHMSRLLDDLMDVSRITRGVLELKKGTTELTMVVGAAIETARPALDAKRHSLSVDLPAQPVRLEADPVRLAQVLSNLLINAAKYTEPDGLVELRAAREGEQVVISVRDDGIGIPAEMKPRLFTMFSQGPAPLGRTEGGLGVGLSLVRGLVTLHGGTVEARSDGAGCGSEFIVRLPIGSPPPARVVSAEPPQAGASGAGLKVLVVDDNRDAADTGATLLEVSGHEVRTAYTGQRALELAESFKPHALLLDIGLPDVDGYQLARTMRATPWGHSMALIAVTGWGQEEDRRRALEAGFDHHVTKPIAAETMDLLLRSVTAG